jgi:APA family basic amino acid/polyamine antiporter
VPFYPWTILVFIAAEWLVVASTFVHDWRRSVIGLLIALAGLPVYAAWRRTSR